MFFRYLQLRHAVLAQFPNGVSLKSHGVESFLISKNVDRILSSLYLRISSEEPSSRTKLFQKCKTDLPVLEDDDWEEGILQYIPLMISAKERYIQLKFIHRAYYTPPEALEKIYPTQSDRCPKCTMELGTFLHVVWACPFIQKFWEGVVLTINSVGNISLGLDPLVLLWGICDRVASNTHKQLVFYATFYARKAILLNWKQPDPPSVSQWKALVDSILPLYKLTYMSCKCPKKI